MEKKVGLPYHSPHKFRHGFAVYSFQNANGMGDYKAISQNMMHTNLSITDGIYGMFSQDEVKNRIIGLGENSQKTNFSEEELNKIASKVAEELKNKINI